MARARLYITTVGGREFQRLLRDRRFRAEWRREAANLLQPMLDALLPKLRAQLPRRTGRLHSSVRTARSRSSVRVRVGGARAPYAFLPSLGVRPALRRFMDSDAVRSAAVRAGTLAYYRVRSRFYPGR